ncbi:T-box-containing protein TBX6L [Fundulus heteroclitus]|uniref:T-box-containing protein TBX6L n=1 Tax=Fundulus heteroclitus TaxID=8078 RepID=UPI00165C2454|nr:T-box-containing protein TBX6L [Fundulus heteroclitus]
MKTARGSSMPNISDFPEDPRSNLGMPLSSSAATSYQQGCIRMTLENSELWKSFHAIGTEMIITKHGRRMFPHCSISLAGLQPYANYVIMVDIVPADSFKYKWKKEQWEVAGKSEPQPPCRTYIHPDSPAVGSHWMKQSLSFLKMKLTNNTLDQHGHMILHSMHRYYPRFHVIQADSPHTVCWGSFQTFSFPETVFTAVTAYQNPKITRLKIDHNPFAKGFREGGTHTQSKRCRSNKGSPAKESTEDRKSLCNSAAGLQRMPSTSQSAQAGKKQASTQQSLKAGHLSPWSLEPDLSDSMHTEALELQEYDNSCEEQMVPASMAYQPYRFPLPPGNRDPTEALFHAPPHPLSTVEPGTQQQEYRYSHQQGHHRNPADWSQYPLFSYSRW